MPTFIRLGTVVTSIALACAPVAAQSALTSTRLPVVEITPYAGYLITGNFVEGPLGVSLASASGPVYGAQLTIPLAQGISIMGNIAGSKGDLELGLPIVGGISVGRTETLLYDGGLQFSAPGLARGDGALVPFVQVGAGGMRQDFDVGGVRTDVVSFAWNAGLGLDLAFGSAVGIRLLAKDYISEFDVREATGIDADVKSTNNWSFVAGLRFSF